MDELVAGVLQNAVEAIRIKGIPVYTFALYYDHESPALSVCIDTAANSRRFVLEKNAYHGSQFRSAIRSGDLKGAAHWSANVGRSLSLGDFAFVNVARLDLDSLASGDALFLPMLRGLLAHEAPIASLAPAPESLIFCCSGPTDEVQYLWAPDPTRAA